MKREVNETVEEVYLGGIQTRVIYTFPDGSIWVGPPKIFEEMQKLRMEDTDIQPIIVQERSG